MLTREQLDRIKAEVEKRYDPDALDSQLLMEVKPDISETVMMPFDVNDIEVKDSFMDHLYTLMDKHHFKKDPEVYKKAGLSPDVWSSYKNKGVLPRKNIVFLLAIAMNLNLKETTELLERSNNAFSPCNKADLVVRACIKNRFYDFDDIEQALYDNGLKTLSKE